MSYNTSLYSSDAQASIAAIVAKTYGVPDATGLTAFVPNTGNTSAHFNLRITQLEGLIAYLEDVRRDEVTRATSAETQIAINFGRLVRLVIGSARIITPYTGTLTGVSLALALGECGILGIYETLPYVNYTVVFTTSVVQVLVAKDDGTITIHASGYSPTSHELVVGNWSGSAYTAVSLTSAVNPPLTRVATFGALPTPSVTYDTQQFVVTSDGTTVPDAVYRCLLQADGVTYWWAPSN